jgi:hypothetical protein
MLTKNKSPILVGTSISNAPNPRPSTNLAPRKEFPLLLNPFQSTPVNTRRILTTYTGLRPQILETTEAINPAIPLAQNCHPLQRETIAKEVWNSCTRTPWIGDTAGPTTAAANLLASHHRAFQGAAHTSGTG